MISAADGQRLRSLIAHNPKTTITFPSPAHGKFIPNNQTGGAMSTQSSWGPTNQNGMYPHFAAPGGNIYSTYPLVFGGYAVLSSDGMATAYVAGVAALYLSAKGKTDPIKLRSLLSTTANPVDWNDGFSTTVGLKAPVAQQGSGLIDAYRMVKATTMIEPGFLELNVS